jgi:hypothetical protein
MSPVPTLKCSYWRNDDVKPSANVGWVATQQVRTGTKLGRVPAYGISECMDPMVKWVLKSGDRHDNRVRSEISD